MSIKPSYPSSQHHQIYPYKAPSHSGQLISAYNNVQIPAMYSTGFILTLLHLVVAIAASPVRRDASSKSCLSDPKCGPFPGETSYYTDYPYRSPPFPANTTGSIAATATGPAGEDDILFQNLLSAEWAVFNFYQQGVEAFNESVFINLGLPNTTYQRIIEIRDNEAGHLRIFQDSISAASIKPGACKYDYGFSNALDFLNLQNIIEVSSMAFLTGLAQQAKEPSTVGALAAIGQTETRHEVGPASNPHSITLSLTILGLGSHRRLGY